MKLKVLGVSTKEERDSYRKAAAQLRFLKGAYRLLWNTKYAGKTATNLGGKIDLFEAEVRKIEEELRPVMDELMRTRRRRIPQNFHMPAPPPIP